jgi:hypothetical protein
VRAGFIGFGVVGPWRAWRSGRDARYFHLSIHAGRMLWPFRCQKWPVFESHLVFTNLKGPIRL